MDDVGQSKCRSKRPRPENTVFYRLFPSRKDDTDAGLDHDLTYLAVKCTELAERLAEDHVWHYEQFRLGVWPRGKQESTYPPHLYGCLCYRDNVEDEWLVVYLLSEISKQLPHLLISMGDEDGEFLLIEAAHYLPRWLRPETAENRVFLYRGVLHIIPKPHTPSEITRYPVTTPTLQEAIDLVINTAVPTEAPGDVQEAIQHRLSCFPAAVKTSRHRAHCYVPWPVGHVMSRDPSLVAAAVHALCDRGPADMRAVRSMSHFSPSTHSSFMTEVTFTRCLYAKLLHQRFTPLPHSGFTQTLPTSPAHKSHDLGMKLTCGLEMLACAVGGVRKEKPGVQQDISTDPHWIKFLKTLQRKDYFQGELDGSQLHQKLMRSAREYFTSNVMPQSELGEEGEGHGRDPLTAAGLTVVQILTSDPGREEDVRERSSVLSPPDDDGWLQISPTELDAMMRKAAGYLPQDTQQAHCSSGSKVDGEETGGEATGQGTAVEAVVHGIKSFVDTMSSHEGAELPWSAGGTVEFDSDTVLRMLEEMMGKEGGDEVMSDSGDSGTVDSEEVEMREIMEKMDQELEASGFRTSLDPGAGQGGRDGVQNDLNLAHNLLSSLSAQPEAAGPASNILHSLGIPVPEPDQHGTETNSSRQTS